MSEFANHVTNYWCRTLGIHSKDLTTHPQIDDVIILIKYIQEYSKELTPRQTLELHLIWNSCYNNKKPLGKRDLKALLDIGQRLNHIRNLKAQHKQKARHKIKALRKQ